MAWVKLDDGYFEHPKILKAGPEGALLDLRAMCYASRNKTDGFVPDDALAGISDDLPRTIREAREWPGTRPIREAGRGRLRGRTVAEVTARLVVVGRWVRDDQRGGWWIHDFLDYNPSAETRRSMTQAAAERKRRERKRRKLDTASHAVTPATRHAYSPSFPTGKTSPAGSDGVTPAPAGGPGTRPLEAGAPGPAANPPERTPTPEETRAFLAKLRTLPQGGRP